MTRQPIAFFAALPLLAFATGALADADTSLGIRAGTLGGGLELSHALSPHVGLRLNADAYNRSGSSSQHDVDYDYKLRLRTAGLTADWFPFANNFRLSLGGLWNGNKIKLHGKPSGGATYTNNRPTLSAAAGRPPDGDLDFHKSAPYLGLRY